MVFEFLPSSVMVAWGGILERSLVSDLIKPYTIYSPLYLAWGRGTKLLELMPQTAQRISTGVAEFSLQT